MSKIICLTQGQSALVDDEDYNRLNQWKWYARFAKTNDMLGLLND